jgi:hypothetical protein
MLYNRWEHSVNTKTHKALKVSKHMFESLRYASGMLEMAMLNSHNSTRPIEPRPTTSLREWPTFNNERCSYVQLERQFHLLSWM